VRTRMRGAVGAGGESPPATRLKGYCRYHIVIVPKYRHKAIFGMLRRDIGKLLRELCERSGIELVEGHAMPDHVHLCLSVPPEV
jgi:putative transposase